jgi:hypothetical protein
MLINLTMTLLVRLGLIFKQTCVIFDVIKITIGARIMFLDNSSKFCNDSNILLWPFCICSNFLIFY